MGFLTWDFAHGALSHVAGSILDNQSSQECFLLLSSKKHRNNSSVEQRLAKGHISSSASLFIVYPAGVTQLLKALSFLVILINRVRQKPEKEFLRSSEHSRSFTFGTFSKKYIYDQPSKRQTTSKHTFLLD